MPRTPVPRPTWTRRVPGSVFLLFFVSLIALTYFAVYYYNANDLVSAGYLAGLASVVPVFLVIAAYYAAPVWALPVDLPVEGVAKALDRATHSLSVEPVAERKGAFARCVAVVRFQAPSCTVGWYLMPDSEKPASPLPHSTVVLRSETRDRKALAAFRDTLARAFGEAESPVQLVT
jgi:hypothetical protein